jgi:dipeptidyl aminopeptidase/acylaminoacyl peptidase
MHRTDVRHLLAGSLWLWFLAATAPVASAQSHGFTARDMLEVAVASVLDLTEDGRRVAVAIRRPADNAETDHRRFGDPTYLSPAFVRLAIIDTRSGRTHEPFKWLVHVRQAAWTRDGERLALLLAEPADSPDGLPRTRLYVWHAAQPPARALREVEIKGEARVSLNSDLEWTADGSRLIATLRTVDQDREAGLRFRALTEAPVIVHASSEPFLEWDDLRRLDRMREIVHIDPATGAVTTKVPRARIASYRVARDGSFITIAEDVTEKTDYDTIFGSLNTLRYVGADGTTRTVADGKDLKDVQVRWSDDGRSLAYSKKGDVFVQKIDEEKPRQVTGKKGDPDEGAGEVDGPDARRRDDGAEEAEKKKESFSVVSFSRDGQRLLATSKKGWYVIQVVDGSRDCILALDDEDEHNNPRVTPLDWSPDGAFIYLTHSERDKWDRGITRLDLASRQLVPVVRDHRSYSSVRLSRDGSTFVFALSDGQHMAELYAADTAFRNVRKLTDLNPWAAQKRLPKSELVSYRDVDGKLLHGVLRYPVNYEPGRRYPTIFELYETFFDNGFNARAAFLPTMATPCSTRR